MTEEDFDESSVFGRLSIVYDDDDSTDCSDPDTLSEGYEEIDTLTEPKEAAAHPKASGHSAQIPIRKLDDDGEHEHVELVFCLYCEPKKKVELIIKDSRDKNTEVHMKSCSGSTCLYSASTKISLSRCNKGEVTYCYRRRTPPVIIERIFRGEVTDTETEEKVRTLKDFTKDTPIRDYWGVFDVLDTIPSAGFISHCLHIFRELSNDRIIEAIHDIDLLMKKMRNHSPCNELLDIGEIKDLVKMIMRNTLQKDKAIAILIFLSGTGFDQVQQLNEFQATMIIKNVCDSKQDVSCLSKLYQEKIPKILYDICAIAYKDKMSMLLLIDKTFPFLDAKEFIDLMDLKDGQIRPCFTRHSLDNVTEDVEIIFNKLTKKEPLKAERWTLLDDIIKQLDFQELRELRKSIKDNDQISEIFKTRCIRRIRDSRDLKELYELCKFVDQSFYETFNDVVYKKLLDFLRHDDVLHSVSDNLRIMSFFCHIFFKNCVPNKMIELIVLFPDNKEHCLFQLLNHEVFAKEEAYCKKSIELWMEKKISSLKANISMTGQIYSWLENINQLPAFKDETCVSIEDRIFKAMEIFSFWDIFTTALLQNSRTPLLETHFINLLNSKMPIKVKMEDLQKRIISRVTRKFNGDQLIIDSFCTTLLVLLLDMIEPHCDKMRTDGLKVVKLILDDGIFWMSIIRSGGETIDTVRRHNVFKIISSSFGKLMDDLESNRFNYEFASTMNDTAILDILAQLTANFTKGKVGMLKNEIEKACNRIFDVMQSLQSSLEMLKVLDETLPYGIWDYFSPKLANITSVVKYQLSSLESNQHDLDTCLGSAVHDKCKKLQRYYDCVATVLGSEVFWKINESNRELLLNRTILDDLLAVETFLEMLKTKFLRRYLSDMENILSCPSLTLTDINGLTDGRNIDKEIEIMLKNSLDVSNWEISFRNFFKFEEHCIKLTLLFSTVTILIDKSLLPDRRFKALMKLQHKLQQKIDGADGFLREMDKDFQKIATFASQITNDVQEALELIQISTELLQFLQEISVDNIHNMADSLEEYSEEIVRKSTVISLIEVEKVFRSILNKDWKTNQSADEILLLLLSQCHDLKEFTRRLDECIANIFSLTDLHLKHKSKGDRTEDIINNIVNLGTINFELVEYRSHIWISLVDCSKTPRDKNRTKHSPIVACYRFNESELADLQSRARLICNTVKQETKVRSNLENFVDLIETGFEVTEILMELKDIGHYKYIDYKKQQQCNKLEIKCLLETMKTDYDDWKEQVKKVREEFPCLNCVHSEQLASLYEYFVQGKLNQDAKSLLSFVKPTYSAVPNVRKNNSLQFSSVDILKYIAKQIQRMEKYRPIESIQLPSRQNSSRNLNAQLRKSNYFVSRLSENSKEGFSVLFAIHMDRAGIFPKANQVIVCTSETTWPDVKVFLMRCWCRPRTEDELYCIVNGDLLCDKTLQQLSKYIKKLSKGMNNTLAIIFRGNESSAFLERHHDVIQQIDPLSIAEMTKCIKNAWPSVFRVTSTVAGLGKSEFIHAFSRKYKAVENTQTLHISSVFNKSAIIKMLQKLKISGKTLLHIDLGIIDHPEDLDQFLFELIVLRYVRNGHHSVFLRTQHIAIEIANTIHNTLYEKLTLLSYFKTVNIRWEGYNNLIVSQEINSPMQIVCRYLFALQKNILDQKDLTFNETNAGKPKPLSKENCRKILSDYFQIDTGMSYSRIHIFLSVFSSQLKKFTESEFFQSKRISDIQGADSQSIPTVRSSMVTLMLEISREFSCRSVENSTKLQASTHTLCNTVKHVEETDLYWRDGERKIPRDEKRDNKEEHSQHIIRWEDINHILVMFHQDGQTLSLLYKELPCESEYVKAVKNFIRLQVNSNDISLKDKGQSLLKDIFWKIACKSAISREDFESVLENYVLTPDNILKFTLILLRVRANIPVVLLGDTGCGKTSLIKVLARICDVRFQLLTIHAGITEEKIVESILKINDEAERMFSEDVWLFIDEINTNENVGLLSDVLCHHVCLEHVLAPNLRIVAACNPYRFQRVKSMRKNIGLCRSFSKSNKMSHLVYHVHPLPESLLTLVWDFGTLGKEDEMKYIQEMLKVCDMDAIDLELFTKAVVESHEFVRTSEYTEYSVSLRDVERARDLWKWFTETYFVRKYNTSEGKNKDAIILTLNLCYRVRLQSHDLRKCYIKRLIDISGFYTGFEVVVQTEQDDTVRRMQLPAGIAVTNTLSENIFTMMICALNFIPLFVVGKPGCGKTLSIQLLRSNLRGDDSRDEFFKQLPCLFCVTYLGTKSSTSESIQKAFQKAIQYQEQHEKVQALLILDDIGQADGSDYNPLKVLHSLLEGKGVHADVAVIGISNWELDAAKMNRAIHLARPDMEEKELVNIGSSLYNSLALENGSTGINPPEWIGKLAKAYREYTQREKNRNFYGLRDFYHLVRHISEKANSQIRCIDNNIIVSGILRNFAGLEYMDSAVLTHFMSHMSLPLENESKDSVLERIRANITDKKSRHLMLISHGDASLAAVIDLLEELNCKYVQLFGSTLPSDQSKEYYHRILSEIILCMEHGNVVVLKNLQNIYGNLYDMLNQSYCVVGGKRHCRVALSADYFPMCCVHDDFKCIIFVDREDVLKTDVPLLNRFEKQSISLEQHLTNTNQEALRMLEEKLEMMTELGEDKKINQSRLMPIHGKDSLSSLVSYATGGHPKFKDPFQIWRMCIDLFNPEIITVLKTSKLGKEEQPLVEEMQKTFWEKPIHKGLRYYLLKNSSGRDTPVLVLTHSIVDNDIKNCFPDKDIKIESMRSVRSEKKLRRTMQSFEKGILMLQFPPGVPAESITFVKTLVETENRNKETDRQIVLLVHMDRCCDQKLLNTIEFSGKWNIVTLDCLLSPFKPLSEIVGKSVLEVLEDMEGYFLTKGTLYWAFTRIRYVKDDDDDERGIDRIENVLEKLEIVRNYLWKHIISCIRNQENHGNGDINADQWQNELAKRLCLNPSIGSFIAMIEKYLMECIRYPLAVLVYHLEKKNALQYLIKIDGADASNKIDRWCALLDQENLLQENAYIKPSGPGCFKIQHENTEYKVPFGKCIIEKVELFKKEFLAEQEFSDAKKRISSQFELVSKLRKNMGEFEKLKYDGFGNDYLCDFKTYLSLTTLSSLPLETRMKVISWVKDIFTLVNPRDTLEIVANLHITFWMHSETINGVLRLLQLTHIVGLGDVKQIIDDINNSKEDYKNDDEDYPKLSSLTKTLCQDILPSSSSRGLIDDDLNSWQQTAYALKFVSKKLNDEPPCLIPLNMFLELATAVKEKSSFTFDALKQLGDTITLEKPIMNILEIQVEMKLRDIMRDIKDKDRLDFIHSCYLTKCILAINDSKNEYEYVLRKITRRPDCKYLSSALRYLLEQGDYPEDLKSYTDIDSVNRTIAENIVLSSLQDCFDNNKHSTSFALILGDILAHFDYKFSEEFLSSANLEHVGNVAELFVALYGSDAHLPKLLLSAILKQFLSFFVEFMAHNRNNIDEATLGRVNIILGRHSSVENISDMQLYFLQRLEEGNGILYFETKCMESRYKAIDICKVFLIEQETRDRILDLTVERMCGFHRYEYCKRLISNEPKPERELDILGVFAYALSNFYLKQCFDDIDHNHANLVSELPITDYFQLKILKVLTLQDDTRLHLYQLSKNSSPCDIYLASFAMFFLSMLSENRNGIWMKIVEDQDVAIDINETSRDTKKNKSFFNCQCGHRVLFQKIYEDQNCPICLHQQSLKPHEKGTPYTTPTSPSGADMVLEFLCGSERMIDVSPICQHILKLLIYLCISCSYGLNKMNEKKVAMLLMLTKDNAIKKLQSKLRENWKSLAHILSVGHCELYHILTILLVENQQEIYSAGRNDNSDYAWISTTQESIHSTIQRNRFVTSEAKLLEKHNTCIAESEVSKIKKLLDEDGVKDGMGISFFRKTSNPSIESLRTELWLLEKKEKFPFLHIVLERYNDLKMLKHIDSLIKWHLSTVQFFNYSIKNSDRNLSFYKFVLQQTGASRRRIEIELNYEDFFNDWFELVEYLKANFYLSIDFTRLSRDSKVSEILNLDTNSQIQRAINILVSVQNEFLDEAMSICIENSSCKSLGFMKYGMESAVVPTYPLINATSDVIINFDMLRNLRFSQNDTAEGHGRQMEYNYRRIEFELAQEVLTGKAHLLHAQQRLPSFQFKDDVFKNTRQLIEQIANSVKQKPLPSTVSEDIRENMVDREELLTISEVLLAHMNHVGTDSEPSVTLVEYMEEKKHNFGVDNYENLVPNKRFFELKVCHVVAFYRLMEELNGERVLESKQNIYGHELTLYSKTKMNNIDARFLEVFLAAMRTFAFRCLRNDEDVNNDMILKDETCLGDPEFWPHNTMRGEKIYVGDTWIFSEEILDANFCIKHIWTMHEHIENVLKNGDVMMARPIVVPQIFGRNPLPSSGGKSQRKSNI